MDEVKELKGNSVSVFDWYAGEEAPQLSALLKFSSGISLACDFWRVISAGKAIGSSFDHKQKYGLPSPVDAIAELKGALDNKIVDNAIFDTETGDLLIAFTDGTKLQVFNFTGYEVFRLFFPDGRVSYSNDFWR